MNIIQRIFGKEFPVILAPMAGITDEAFRLLCKQQGADGLVTEMVSAKALYYKNKNTGPILAYQESEHPIGVQIFGSDPELMGQMAGVLCQRGFDFIDINMGCPVPKIVNNKEGSALMLQPELAGRIVREVCKCVSVPVTVKFRKGFDEEHVNAVEFARIIEDNGAAAITVHGRTRSQYYSGKADWEIIRRVRENVSIPVIGNGDIFHAQDVLRMREETGCHGVMVARGAKGNPWIFREISCVLAGKEIPARPSDQEVIDMLLAHAALNVEKKGEKMGIREMRKHTAWYTSGMRGSAKLRKAVNQVETFDQLKGLFMR